MTDPGGSRTGKWGEDMKKFAVLGIDFGISKVHTNLISPVTGELYLENEIPYRWDVMEDNRGETDPDKIWECAQDSVEALFSKADFQQLELEALSFSCFGDCFVAADREGKAIYPMLAFSDRRAEEIWDELNGQIPGHWYQELTGGPLDPGYVVSKIYWMKEKAPQIYEKAENFFNIQQYILKKIGLEPLTDYSMAARRMMFDVKNLCWPEKLCRVLEKDPACFGKAVPASTAAGKIKQFGRVELPREVEVVLGAHDAMCGFLGLGAEPDENGVVANNAGTYNLLGTLSRQPFRFDTVDVTPGCGPVEGSYHCQAGGMIGPTVDWYARQFGRASLGALFEKTVFDGNCRIRMLQDPMTGNGVFSGLSVKDGPEEVFTGLIESCTLPMKGWLKTLRKGAEGTSFQKVRIGAGGAKSDSWIQLKADVLELPVEKVKNLQTSSVGVAMICAVAKGIYKDYKEAAKAMVQTEKVFVPDEARAAKYRERYLELYNN